MKPSLEDKLVVSLLGVKRDEDATALLFSVLWNLDGEGRRIDDCERTLIGVATFAQ